MVTNGNLAMNENMASLALVDSSRLIQKGGQGPSKVLGSSHSNKRLPSWKQGSSSLVMEMGRYSNVANPGFEIQS